MLIRYHTEAILSIPAPAPLRPYASVRLPFGRRRYAVKKRFSRRIKTNRKCKRSSFFIIIFFYFFYNKKAQGSVCPSRFSLSIHSFLLIPCSLIYILRRDRDEYPVPSFFLSYRYESIFLRSLLLFSPLIKKCSRSFFSPL